MSFKKLHIIEQLPLELGPQLSADSLSVTFATDASLPITLSNDTNFGTPGANTLRTAAMLGVGSTAVSNSNPVPISDAGGTITVDGTVAATQSGAWSVAVTDSVLPDGAATEFTVQGILGYADTTNTFVQSIDGTVAQISGQLPTTIGQAASAGSLSVVLASDQTLDVALPTNAAQEDTLQDVLTATGLTQISVDAIDTKTPALGQALAAASVPVVIASDQTITVSATDLDIRDLSSATDSVAAVQSGAWTVGLPTGAATEAKQDTGNTSVASIDTKTVQQTLGSQAAGAGLAATLSTRHEAAATPVAVRISNGSGFTTPSPTGRTSVELIRNDYAADNVTTAAYVELVASTSAVINQLDVFDSSGQTMVLAIGAAASEVDTYYVAPGGNGKIDLAIAAGSRISVKAVSANATVGELTITALS